MSLLDRIRQLEKATEHERQGFYPRTTEEAEVAIRAAIERGDEFMQFGSGWYRPKDLEAI